MDKVNKIYIKQNPRYNPKKDKKIKNGLYELYDMYNCLISKGNYINNLKEGEWKDYYHGNLTSIGNYVNGLKEGEWKDYNNIHSEITNKFYINDKLNGKYIKKYLNGDPISIGNYINNKKEGYWEEYQFGKIRKKSYYINNIQRGYLEEYIYYDSEYEMDINYDRVVRTFTYDTIFTFGEDWIELPLKELKKIESIIKLNDIILLDNKYFYTFGDKLDFIAKLEDDYYYLYHNCKYIKCDQISELIKKLKNI